MHHDFMRLQPGIGSIKPQVPNNIACLRLPAHWTVHTNEPEIRGRTVICKASNTLALAGSKQNSELFELPQIQHTGAILTIPLGPSYTNVQFLTQVVYILKLENKVSECTLWQMIKDMDHVSISIPHLHSQLFTNRNAGKKMIF